MKIQSTRIQNFRTLKDVTIPFDSVTTFVGPNGAGKSTVLRALDWFFNGKPNSLTIADCTFGTGDEAIEVQVTFSDLTEGDRTELGKYAPPEATTFTAWKRRTPDGAESLSANARSYEPFNVIRARASAGDKKSAYLELRSIQPGLELPTWSNTEAALQAMTAWEARNIEQLTDAP
jgi:putative ATP-dependent endonuclease of OLD family